MATLNMMTQLGIGDNLIHPAKRYPEGCSYFEHMCQVAEYSTDPIEKAQAEQEVQEMTDSMNKAAEDDRTRVQQQVIDYIGEYIGVLFDEIHFRSNDETTQMYLQNAVMAIMFNLFKVHYIHDFRVICDASNNPPSVVDRNELKLNVWFKIDKGANSFHLPFTKTGLSAAIDPDFGTPKSTSNGQGSGKTLGNSSGGFIPGTPIHGGYPTNAAPQNTNQSQTVTIGGPVGSTAVGSTGYFVPVHVMNIVNPVMPYPDTTITSKLEDITITDSDENGIQYRITLAPERSISAYEVLMISRMLESLPIGIIGNSRLSPLAFIRENNLERHFKITT